MCDGSGDEPRMGWAGWAPAPKRSTGAPLGDWCDLTHSFSQHAPRLAIFPPPIVSKFASMPENPANVSRLDTVVHVGTHVDAPRHFYADGPGMDEVPLDRLVGAGVVASMRLPEFGEISARDLEAVTPAIREGDILAICTGWEKQWETDGWNRHPCLTQDAADWLVSKKIRLFAIDTPTPDLATERRDADFDFPIHCTLLKHGVLISEQVANLERLAGSRVEFMFCPVPILGSDGAPARVLARRVAD
jgi:arylformamidase